jgi:hypothetical protein
MKLVEATRELWGNHGLVTHGSIAKAAALGIDPESMKTPPRDIDVFGAETTISSMGGLVVDANCSYNLSIDPAGGSVTLRRGQVDRSYEINIGEVVDSSTGIATPSGVAIAELSSNLFAPRILAGLRAKRFRLDLNFARIFYCGGLISPRTLEIFRQYRQDYLEVYPNARLVDNLKIVGRPIPGCVKNNGLIRSLALGDQDFQSGNFS